MPQLARRGRHGLYLSLEAEMGSQDWLGRPRKLSRANLAENSQINTAGTLVMPKPPI